VLERTSSGISAFRPKVWNKIILQFDEKVKAVSEIKEWKRNDTHSFLTEGVKMIDYFYMLPRFAFGGNVDVDRAESIATSEFDWRRPDGRKI